MDNNEQRDLLQRISVQVEYLKDGAEETQNELKALAKSVNALELTVNTVSEKVKAMIGKYKWPSPKYIVGIIAAALAAAGVAVPSILNSL